MFYVREVSQAEHDELTRMTLTRKSRLLLTRIVRQRVKPLKIIWLCTMIRSNDMVYLLVGDAS